MNFNVKSTIKIDTSQLDKLKKRLENLAKHTGEVGFFQEDTYSDNGSDRDGHPVASIAYANNYGVQVVGDVPIPMRPFFTLAVEEMKRSFHSDISNVVRSVMNGASYRTSFTNYLRGFRNTVQMEIMSSNSPPNRPKTVMIKGRNDPLIDSGKMLKSTRYRINKR